MILTPEDLVDLTQGAAFLGTGGGGDPYIGRLMVREAMAAGNEVEIIDLEEVPDDALIIPTAMMGASTVIVEKLPAGDEAVASLSKLEAILGRKAYATMPIEVGGINSTIPLVVGALLGLPIVDADGMGRAFPELQMETVAVYGVPGSPIVITNEYGDSAVIETRDNVMLEWLARGVTIRMGGSAFIAEYAMDGKTAKRTSVPRTLSLARQIGACLRRAREEHTDPFAALIDLLPKHGLWLRQDHLPGQDLRCTARNDTGFCPRASAHRGARRMVGDHGDRYSERKSGGSRRRSYQGDCSRSYLRARQRDSRANNHRDAATRPAGHGHGRGGTAHDANA